MRRAKAVEVSDKVPGRNQYDVSFKLNRTTTEAGVYPITLVSYHIVCLHYDDAAKAALVKAFMGYVGSQAGQDGRRQGRRLGADDRRRCSSRSPSAVAQISAG